MTQGYGLQTAGRSWEATNERPGAADRGREGVGYLIVRMSNAVRLVLLGPEGGG
jgi:hypothetical protein